MSATINASKFAQYFATPVLGTLLPAPIVSAGDSCVHTVQTYYLDSLINVCQKKPVSIVSFILYSELKTKIYYYRSLKNCFPVGLKRHEW